MTVSALQKASVLPEGKTRHLPPSQLYDSPNRTKQQRSCSSISRSLRRHINTGIGCDSSSMFCSQAPPQSAGLTSTNGYKRPSILFVLRLYFSQVVQVVFPYRAVLMKLIINDVRMRPHLPVACTTPKTGVKPEPPDANFTLTLLSTEGNLWSLPNNHDYNTSSVQQDAKKRVFAASTHDRVGAFLLASSCTEQG